MRPRVLADDHHERASVDSRRWAKLAEDVLAAEGVGVVELSVTFVDRNEMVDLNERFLGGSGATDVLAFPLDDGGSASHPGVPVLLGDVVICPEVAAANASGHAGTVDDELALLVVHGTLHLLGHDHADVDECLTMQHRERALLASLYGPLSGDPWTETP